MKIKSRALLKILILVPFLLVIYILQATVFSRLRIFNVTPLLLPLAAAAIAISEGSVKGGAFGLVAGMLCDLSFSQPTIQFTLALTAVGIATGLMAETLLVKNFTTYLLCSALTLVFCSVCQAFPFIFFREVSLAPLLAVSVRQFFASLIFTLPIYYFFRLVNRSSRF